MNAAALIFRAVFLVILPAWHAIAMIRGYRNGWLDKLDMIALSAAGVFYMTLILTACFYPELLKR